jgi:hypothetical protein
VLHWFLRTVLVIVSDMNESPVFQLKEFPAHLGLGATVEREPRFTGIEWYREYSQRHATDAGEGRLVSMHSFSASWDSWEMHPAGSELVVCTAGRMTLHQEINGSRSTMRSRQTKRSSIPPALGTPPTLKGLARRYSSRQGSARRSVRAEFRVTLVLIPPSGICQVPIEATAKNQQSKSCMKRMGEGTHAPFLRYTA